MGSALVDHVAPPLRILGVVSSPADHERLDVERERANLEGALSGLISSGAVELRWLEAATVERLLSTLQGGEFHALRYVGHGTFDRQSDRGLCCSRMNAAGDERSAASS
jgi:hypothetical protein